MICLNMNYKGTLKISSSFSDKARSTSCTNRKKLQNLPDFQVFYQAVTLIVILVLNIPITKTL